MWPRRRVLVRSSVVAVVWLVATALAGAVAWTAVSRLGREGTATAARPLSGSDVRQRLDRSAPARPVVPHAEGGPAPGADSSRVRSGKNPANRPLTAQASARTSRSWQLTGGTVGTACRGQAIDLLYASPLDGWGYRLDTQTPATLSIEFSRGPQTAALTARCVNGVPARVPAVAHDDAAGSDDGSGD